MRVMVALIAVLTNLVTWWLFGYDFDERGFSAVMCFLTSVSAALFGFAIGENSLKQRRRSDV